MSRPSPDDPFTIRVPFATTTGGALRLHDGLDVLRGATDGVAPGAHMLDGLQGALALHCDVWRRNQRRFLECYFDFIARHVEDHRPELEARLESFGGLFGYRDWAYSALLPLPRAHLPAPEGEAPFGPETLVPVDFAFWTGVSPIAITLPGSATRAAATDRRIERLRRAGVVVVELADSLLDSDRASDFETALPESFRRFWRDEALPAGPLKPAALEIEPR